MTHSLQAVFENGVLRPLGPVPLREHEEVTVTITARGADDVTDAAFLRHLDAEADESVTIEQVRAALAGIPGSLAGDVHTERDERV